MRMIIYLITKVQVDTATVIVVIYVATEYNYFIILRFIKGKNSSSSSVLVLFWYCCDTSTQSKCLRLSSTARSTLILMKGIELNQTPGPRINAGSSIKHPPAFILKLQVLTRRLYKAGVYTRPAFIRVPAFNRVNTVLYMVNNVV